MAVSVMLWPQPDGTQVNTQMAVIGAAPMVYRQARQVDL